MDLVRLAIPRRVYTQSHIDYVAEVVLAVAADAKKLPGYRLVSAPPVLRHFTATLAPAYRISDTPHRAPLFPSRFSPSRSARFTVAHVSCPKCPESGRV